MDGKINVYALIISQWLDGFVIRMNGGRSSDYELITDGIYHHYQVIRTGWHRDVFEYNVVFHFQIKPTGKVWPILKCVDRLLVIHLFVDH